MITLPRLREGPTRQVFIDVEANPKATAAEIAQRAGIARDVVCRSLSHLLSHGYVERHRVGIVKRGNAATWQAVAAEAEPDTWPAELPRQLPAVPGATLPTRVLRQSVGVVILLDQQRRAA